MFGFGKASKHEEGKVEKKKDDKGGKRIFGVPLEVLTLVEAKCFENDVLQVPVVVRDSIEWLRQHNGTCPDRFSCPAPALLHPSSRAAPAIGLICALALGVVEEGIFRVPGNQAEIDALKKQYDTVGQAKLESHYEAHTIAGLLKLWFRELPEPVLIFRYYETFIRVGSTRPPPATPPLIAPRHREPGSHGAQGQPADAADGPARGEPLADPLLDGLPEGGGESLGEE